MRQPSALALVVGLAAAATPGGLRAQEGEVAATRVQLRDAWISVDAVVLGTYEGVDSTLGPQYHRVQVREVWLGRPTPGPLIFKAPRGVEASPGDETLLMLWDRLNGVTDAYLENARALYGEDAWRRVGPDSIASYLLPFSRYAFAFHKGKLTLRGSSAFPEEVKRSELHDEFLDLEYSLAPKRLFQRSDLVVLAKVSQLDKRNRVIEGISVEYRIGVTFDILELIKGSRPDSLHLDYGSFPRTPRFEQDEEVLLFLTRADDGYFLEQGKRAVFHVRDGMVLETDQPLRPFIQSLLAGG